MRSSVGFTLVEVLVSIALIALILVGFFAALALVSRVNSNTKNQEIALGIVSSELDALRAGGYAGLPSSGSFSDSLLSSLPQGAGTLAITSYSSSTKTVQVSVSWKTANLGTSTVSETTLMTQIGGLSI